MDTCASTGVLMSNLSEFSFKWKITNFGMYLEHTHLTSPTFSTIYFNRKNQWCIRLYPQSTMQQYKKYSSIYLQCLNSEPSEIVSLKFSIVKDNTNVYELGVGDQLFCSQLKSHGFSNFIERVDCLASFLQNDTLTIGCELRFGHPIFVPNKIVNNGNSNKKDLENSKLQKDLAQLFESSMFSDVTIIIGDKNLLLHKAILASRSKVFQTMFQNNIIENEKTIVHITDIKFKVAMEMFRYMYVGTFDDMKQPADELFIAAENYSITELKRICEIILGNEMSLDNALQNLMLATKHNATYLKEQSVKFIVKHLIFFVDKPEFKSLDQNILSELISAIAKEKF